MIARIYRDVPGSHMFIYLRLVLSQNLVVDVEKHPDPEQELVVVPVQMLPVALVQEALGVVLLSSGPVGSVRDGTAANVLGLLPLPSSGNRSGQTGVTLGHLGATELLGSDQVPDEGLDVLVTGVPLEAVDQGEPHGVLRREKTGLERREERTLTGSWSVSIRLLRTS